MIFYNQILCLRLYDFETILLTRWILKIAYNQT